MSPDNITIIIPCFNAETYIKTCIDSIIPNLQSGDQIIVIDDGSKDRTTKILQEYSNENLNIITHTRNSGPSKSRNEGARRSRNQLLLFLDVDTKITKTTLNRIRDFFRENVHTGAVQCELRISDEKLDSIGHFMSITGFPYEIGVGEDPLKYQKILPIFGAKSAGMAVRKKAFAEAGGFDEDYLIYGEDSDLSWRIQLAGYDMKYLPGSIVYHHQKSSLTDKTKLRVYFEGSKNNLNYILKDAPINTALYIVPLHLVGWMLLSVKLLTQGNMQASFAVYRGISWNILNGYRTLEKKQAIARKKSVHIFGSMSILQLIQKGWRWFFHV